VLAAAADASPDESLEPEVPEVLGVLAAGAEAAGVAGLLALAAGAGVLAAGLVELGVDGAEVVVEAGVVGAEGDTGAAGVEEPPLLAPPAPGAVTETTRDASPVFPAESVAVYVSVYMPCVFTSTLPVSTIELEMFAPEASVAVAPGSRNTPP
jgi:hypothetical protein